MSGGPREVIEEYSKTAYAAMPWSSDSSNAADLARVHFEGPGGGPIRTGDPMWAHVAFRFQGPVRDPYVTVSFYWPSGYLCTQLTSGGSCHDRTFFDGLVSFDFDCPIVTMQRGLYRVDVEIARGGEIIGHWRCCSLLRVDPGKIILGDFYLDHSCNATAGPLSTGRK
jgi:hypothetical protein